MSKPFLPTVDSSYIDWLFIDLRKIVSIQKGFNSLVSGYLSQDNLNSLFQKAQFFKLIQFLSFLRTLEYSREFLNDQAFYLVELAVMDFISFLGVNSKSTYQRSKALEFFTGLQEIKAFIQKFSNEEFRRSMMFSYLRLKKQNKKWTFKMALDEELYFYQYTFFLSYFFTYQNTYDLEIKFQLIEIFNKIKLEKRI
jgi:hypothetical protein